MNFSREEIKNFVSRARDENAANSITELNVIQIANGDFKSVKRFLLEMKVQIDRWDLVTRYIYVHPDMLDLIVASLKLDIDKPNKWQARLHHTLWGMDLINDDSLPPDTILAIADLKDLDPDLIKDGQHIALGIYDYKLLERMNKLKTFW